MMADHTHRLHTQTRTGVAQLQRLEHGNGAVELRVITVVERQQRGGARGPRRASQPLRELVHGEHRVPTLREKRHLIGKPRTASNLVITEDENVRRAEPRRNFGQCS